MSIAPAQTRSHRGRSPDRDDGSFVGQRMNAAEFAYILDDGNNYELIDGVVVVSPSPTPRHQLVATEIAGQIWAYLRDHPVGKVWSELDVHFGRGPRGGDLVYKPEIVFVRDDKLKNVGNILSGPPDLVVEVVSKDSRRYDTKLKKREYERFGVGEYWLIDPQLESMTFYRLRGRKFTAIKPRGPTFASQAVPGFKLDLARVRNTFSGW